MRRKHDAIDKRKTSVSPTTVVWRYMRLNQIFPILKNQMYFSRPTQFDDRWEGMFPPSYMRRIRAMVNREPDVSPFIDKLLAQRNYHRHAHFVSCWHMLPHESDAMWRLYAHGPEGIAIKSTVGDLLACFRPPNSGKVQYYDPAADQRASNIFAGPSDILWKREDFAWEREFRIWFDDEEMAEVYSEAGDFSVTEPVEGRFFGITDTKQLIKKIVVAPSRFSDNVIDILTSTMKQHKRHWMVKLVHKSQSEQCWDELSREPA